jgi:diaminohydroxyphosphoribosylaminopyrimidine deaminase/5-amino-6-(5-phosphoribosylamino)uracil reductase
MSPADSPDQLFMRAALDEGRKGIGFTSPNPAVGAVIVKNGELIGRGWHRRAGEPHAEIEAIRSLGDPELAQGATIYVTLEPCSTHGRTPPCTEAILQAGFSRVVVGAVDPNPHHVGKGLELLRARGVEVTSGVLADECLQMNRAFNKWIVTRSPWVIAKAGMSLDGRIARPPGEGQWLTSEASRQDAMRLRMSVDAILVGANTLRADNPRLTIRGLPEAKQKPQPWRIVLTRGENPLPKDAHLFTDEHRDRTLIYTGQPLEAVFADLGAKQVTSVLIEGGMRVLGEAFDKQLVDEVCFYVAPLLCGGPLMAVGGEGVGASSAAPRIVDPEYTRIGSDLRLSGRVAYPSALPAT